MTGRKRPHYYQTKTRNAAEVYYRRKDYIDGTSGSASKQKLQPYREKVK